MLRRLLGLGLVVALALPAAMLVGVGGRACCCASRRGSSCPMERHHPGGCDGGKTCSISNDDTGSINNISAAGPVNHLSRQTSSIRLIEPDGLALAFVDPLAHTLSAWLPPEPPPPRFA